ncbi:hypothetical protein CB1_000750016 [Camelus ferus]|nr:hypothetical protein CB1_000750016 [Camelus ferus]
MISLVCAIAHLLLCTDLQALSSAAATLRRKDLLQDYRDQGGICCATICRQQVWCFLVLDLKTFQKCLNSENVYFILRRVLDFKRFQVNGLSINRLIHVFTHLFIHSPYHTFHIAPGIVTLSFPVTPFLFKIPLLLLEKLLSFDPGAAVFTFQNILESDLNSTATNQKEEQLGNRSQH